MRKLVALIASAVLAAISVAGVSAASTPSVSRATIDATVAIDGRIVGTMAADLAVPGGKVLSPGTYGFEGAAGNDIVASASAVGYIDFWRDDNHEGGSDVAYVEGAECLYFGPNNASCGTFRLMFVDVDDPAILDQVVAFLADGSELHFRAGDGRFRIDVAPIDF
jgi:hypothetical protein